MAQRVILHIGPRKTATTYLQRILQSFVIDGLIPEGMYPVRTRGRLDHNQVPGLIDLARARGEIGLQDDAWTQQDGSDGAALLEAVRSTEGDVILSAEALSVMRDSGARAMVEAFDGTPVDVIITARDLARVLPSSWQQHMRNGNFEAYADYLGLRVDERISGDYATDLRRAFWRAYCYPQLVQRWQDVARSVTFVTVPADQHDPAEMWRRFRDACRIDALPVEPPSLPDDKANVSLTGAETFALQGINLAARSSGMGRREVRAWHRILLKRGWAEGSDRGPRLGLPADVLDQVLAWSRDDVEALRSMDIDVVGDVADLLATPGSGPGLPDASHVARVSGTAVYLAFQRPRARASEDDAG